MTIEKIIKPNILRKDATIGLFSPSEPIIKIRQNKVNAGIKYLEDKGYKIVKGKNYLNNHFYMAGTIEERVNDIHSLLIDDNVDALFATWGGKSENQILPHLDYNLIKNTRKIFLGISDTTCLANAIYAKTGLINFLGPNIVGKLDESQYSDLVFLHDNTNNEYLIDKQETKAIVNKGKRSGRLIGGTLNSFILGVIGTEFEPLINDSILIIESGSRTPQLLDQLLTYMVNTRKFERLNGMVICNIDKCLDERAWGGRNPLDIFSGKFKHFNFPIIQTSIIGHGKLKNPIIPIGAMATLNANEGTLRLIENTFNNIK